jgi:hypothetical protein
MGSARLPLGLTCIELIGFVPAMVVREQPSHAMAILSTSTAPSVAKNSVDYRGQPGNPLD